MIPARVGNPSTAATAVLAVAVVVVAIDVPDSAKALVIASLAVVDIPLHVVDWTREPASARNLAKIRVTTTAYFTRGGGFGDAIDDR